MSEQREPRELTPIQKFWDGKSQGVRDFSPHVQRVDDFVEAEEAITPVPKAESARGSADSSEVVSTGTPISPTSPTVQENPAQTDELTPTEKLEAAVAANGKGSEPSEAAPPMPTTTTPQDESSSQSSSSATSPGSNTPPVVGSPPPVLPPAPPIPTSTPSHP
jgi:hypothetical protein